MIRSAGRRKSNFPALQDIPSDATLDFVSNGTNYKITLTDFLAALGVTGTIQQEGDPAGVPVLDVQGSDNFIRNIEPGIGIAATVSAEGGVTLTTDITSSVAGAPVLDVDETTGAIVGVGIIGGAGVAVSADSETGDITISVSDSPVATKTVIVSQEADFPAAAGGVITLADDTEYLLVNDVSTANRFVLGTKNSLRSGSLTLTELEYTGVDAMFTGTNTQFKIFGMDLNCPSGSLFDIDGPGSVFQLVETNVDCDSGGVIDGVNLARLNGVSWSSITSEGLTFAGTINTLLVEEQVILNLNGEFLDLASAVFTNIICDRIVVQNSQAGSYLISGLVASGNIAVGGLGSLSLNRFAGAGDVLQNISVDDVRWAFAANNAIPDTAPGGAASIVGNVTETVISATSTPVKFAGTWTVERQSQFTVDTTGRITYVGESDYSGSIIFSSSVDAVSGGDKAVGVYLAVNGSIVANTGKSATVASGKPASITGIGSFTFTTGDYVEVWAENNSNTVNLILSQCIFEVT